MKVAWIASLALLAGCSARADAELATANTARLAELDVKVAELQSKIETIEKGNSATLSIDDDGKFSYIQTDFGKFPVKLGTVKDYLGGSKVVISIGNPTNAAVTKFTIIGFCETADSGNKSVQIERTQSLPGGHWTNVEIPVNEVPASKFKSLKISGLVVEQTSMLK